MDTFLVLVMALVGNVLPQIPTGPICTVEAGDEAKAVAWLRGDYGLLGSRSGKPYTGQVSLSGTEDSESLSLTGSFGGTPRQGTARYVRCGPDRVRQLEVTLASGPVLYCVPHNDYDNFNRVSCSHSLSDPNGDHELWVQRLAP